jgi:hypothetical protein
LRFACGSFHQEVPAPLWQTGCAMLIELWERLRGYDKWIETEAEVKSAELSKITFPGSKDPRKKQENAIAWNSECRFVWQDPTSEQHAGSFVADEESSLYQLSEGEKFSIRINPRNPEDFYIRGLLESDVMSAWKAVLGFTLMFLILTLFFLPEIFRFLW